ncbi:hypothetical protein NDU88_004674 [Pleurodeles waltl]|uniref:Uncharacterized protein n=1 Tax=Pleurodeles waltl TaxID=8319 RepID=A0AAV7NPZ9_PLEWA|nr:hypothetical protein NDU88_004674 [Pleurodeles waltl]
MRLLRAACTQPCRRRWAVIGSGRRQKVTCCPDEGASRIGGVTRRAWSCAVSTAGKRSGVAPPRAAAWGLGPGDGPVRWGGAGGHRARGSRQRPELEDWSPPGVGLGSAGGASGLGCYRPPFPEKLPVAGT